MPDNSAVICCPNCFSKIDLAATAPYRFPYSLSIICMTRGGQSSYNFIAQLDIDARELGAEFLVGYETDRVQDADGRPHYIPTMFSCKSFSIYTGGFVEGGLNQLAAHAQGRFVLRLDDDESISPAMLQWLKDKKYEGAPAWAFPTAALWGDDKHFITSPPFWPDTHVRLTAWHMASDWPNEPHGKPDWVRTARPAPVAIRHHKFRIKTYVERQAIADSYEAKLVGGGHGKRLVYSLPEDVLSQLTLSLVGAGPLSNIPQNSGEVIQIEKEN